MRHGPLHSLRTGSSRGPDQSPVQGLTQNTNNPAVGTSKLLERREVDARVDVHADQDPNMHGRRSRNSPPARPLRPVVRRTLSPHSCQNVGTLSRDCLVWSCTATPASSGVETPFGPRSEDRGRSRTAHHGCGRLRAINRCRTTPHHERATTAHRWSARALSQFGREDWRHSGSARRRGGTSRWNQLVCAGPWPSDVRQVVSRKK